MSHLYEIKNIKLLSRHLRENKRKAEIKRYQFPLAFSPEFKVVNHLRAFKISKLIILL